MEPDTEVLKLPTEDGAIEEIVPRLSKDRLVLALAIGVTTLGLFGIVGYVGFTTLQPQIENSDPATPETAYLSNDAIEEIRRNLTVDTKGIDPNLPEAEQLALLDRRTATYVEAAPGSTAFIPAEELSETDTLATTQTNTNTSQNTAPESSTQTGATANTAANRPEVTSNDDTITVVGETVVTNEDEVGEPVQLTRSGIIRFMDVPNYALRMGFIGGDVYQVTATAATEIRIDGRPATFDQLAPDDIIEVVGLGYEASVNVQATQITVTGVYQPPEPEKTGG